MLNLHIKDHPWIAGIAPGCTIAFGQRLLEGTSGVLFNPLHNAAKLGIDIGIFHIGDRHRDTRVPPNIPLFLAIGGMGEFEIVSIPYKPHGQCLWRSIGSNGRHMGKRLCVQDFLYFRIIQICHGLSSLLWYIQIPHTLHYSLSALQRLPLLKQDQDAREPSYHRY